MGLKPLVIGDFLGKGYQGDAIYDTNGLAPTLSAQAGNNSKGSVLIACGQTNGTSTPLPSTDTTGTTAQCTKEISGQLTLLDFQPMTSSLVDSLVRLSRLLASGEDSQTYEALSFLKSAELRRLAELSIYSLRTSKDCLITRAGLHFKPLSQRWMNWGMTVNGRCLTAATTYPKTGSACSLSQILEANPDPKYFLSDKIANRILSYQPSQRDITGGKPMVAISVTDRHTEHR